MRNTETDLQKGLFQSVHIEKSEKSENKNYNPPKNLRNLKKTKKQTKKIASFFLDIFLKNVSGGKKNHEILKAQQILEKKKSEKSGWLDRWIEEKGP